MASSEANQRGAGNGVNQPPDAGFCLLYSTLDFGTPLPLRTRPMSAFPSRTMAISCLLVEWSGVYKNRKRNQKRIPAEIKSSRKS